MDQSMPNELVGESVESESTDSESEAETSSAVLPPPVQPTVPPRPFNHLYRVSNKLELILKLVMAQLYAFWRRKLLLRSYVRLQVGPWLIF
jgi:hypothetical protein